MNKIDRRDYQISGYGISDEMKKVAEQILQLIKRSHNDPITEEIDVQDFDIEIYINSDPFSPDPANYIIDIQIKGLGKK